MFAPLICKELDAATGLLCVSQATMCFPGPASPDPAKAALSTPYLAFTVQREYTLISL